MNRAGHFREAEKVLRQANGAEGIDAAVYLLLKGVIHALLANASAQVSVVANMDDREQAAEQGRDT